MTTRGLEEEERLMTCDVSSQELSCHCHRNLSEKPTRRWVALYHSVLCYVESIGKALLAAN